MRGLDAFQSILSHLFGLHALDVGSEGGEGVCLVLPEHNRLHITTATTGIRFSRLSHYGFSLDRANWRALLHSTATY